MRNKFIDLIYQEMASNESIVFLTADMGINLVEKVQKDYPDRFHNVGIAEQNLIGIAAGLAESGYRPFAYTISNFISIRALEQIRNDLVLHELPVTLVGTSTGFDNAPLGPTHHMLDDWGVLSGLPNIDIFCPAQISSIEPIFRSCLNSTLPTYVRIPKGVGVSQPLLNIGSTDRLVISYGSASGFALEHAQESGMDYLIIEQLSPFNPSKWDFSNYKEIVVIEDHFPSIGLYSKLCQFKNERNLNSKVISIAPTTFSLKVRNSFRDFLR